MLLNLGYNPTLVVSSVDMVREIVKNHDVSFSNKPRTTAVDFMFYECKGMGFAPYGDFWRQVKKMSVVELFSYQRVHSFQFVRDEEMELLINKIRSTCGKGESINLSKMLVLVSSNIVSRCILSHRSEEEDGCSKFGELIRRLMVLFTGFCIGDLFPYMKWIDVLTGYIPSIKALSAELDALLNQVIEEHRAVESRKKDFVSIVMQLQKDGMFEDLTQDNIKAILLDMFVGGTDTSATTAEWIMAELLRHPNAMKKVQQEVRNVVGNKSKVDQEDIAKMDYLKCVVKETLRLHPPVVIVLRKTPASVKLRGFDIPSNTTVMINAWAIHRDPKWWENPEEFIPERFENSSIDFQGQDFHYIPFGFGRRGCPGMPFGVASVEYVIANLLCWFDWKLPSGEIAENVDMTELYGLTSSKKTPLHVLPIYHSTF
ncbi:serine/threonine-protein kinase AFC2-like isoform X1 [Hibiscus syriacus]|uniref:Serine/threonine-protein kinase AFC2-like isoform X1 n=2 Tax=Hibiscus syriacus TaxID=106335 RepID=A0A6A3A8K6_HIBSY|nr:serine/threonine-protein kinase AFC2-like isoform X1 [Hibiscus syriacus]